MADQHMITMKYEDYYEKNRQLRLNATEALRAALRCWLDHTEDHLVPESFDARVLVNTGLQGGDVGHGGRVVVQFETVSGTNGIKFDRREGSWDPDYYGDEGKVILTACGNWEQEGLIASFAALLHKLLPPK